ncbi:MAG: DnaJ domain-containing protein [Eubacteriales bacterium]
MNDPYQILGVSSSASDDEVKKAYREQARKYHPDNYQNNPLADLAEEKMKAINDAYDQITRTRSGKQSAGQGSYSQPNYGGASNSPYARIRNMINVGNLEAAEQALNELPQGAESYFLRGSIAYRRGWTDEALKNYNMAVQLEPGNMEYRQALAMLQRGGNSYRSYGYQPTPCVCGSCDCCTQLMCLNCLCNGCC